MQEVATFYHGANVGKAVKIESFRDKKVSLSADTKLKEWDVKVDNRPVRKN